MVTLFAVPKAFRGHIGVIQRNAIGSWARLGDGARVVLFGDEAGTAEAAEDAGVEHVPEIERNEFGTPLVNTLFGAARSITNGGPLCFVNSDVLLLDDFLPAVERVRSQESEFLMVGECWDVDLPTPVAFDDPSWASDVRDRAAQTGALRGQWAIDYFAFSCDLYDEIPPFAVGRAGFDNWLVWKARASRAAVVDASRVVTAIHQEHDYAHVDGGAAGSHDGPEAVRNRELAGGPAHLFAIEHASHVLTPRHLRRRVQRPGWVRSSLAATQSVRHRLHLRPATGVRRVRSRLAMARSRRPDRHDPVGMSAEERFLFDLEGYVVLPKVLSDEEVAALDAIADERVATERDDQGHHRAFRASAWGPPYQRLIDHPRIVPYLAALVGPRFWLDHDFCIFMAKGGQADDLHGGATEDNPDHWYRYRDGVIRNGLTVVMYCLTPAGGGEGGFCCIPGSHKSNLPATVPDDVRDHRRRPHYVVEPSVEAGDVVIFTEALIHGTAPWNADHERRALVYKYSPGHSAWMDEYYDLDAYSGLTERQRRILAPPSVGERRPSV